MPPSAALEMLPQDFSTRPDASHGWQGWIPFIARLITFGGALALTAFATYQMVLIVSGGSVTVLQWIMVALFCITFVWIALAACAGLVGFLFSGKSRRVGEVDLSEKKTVLLMPVYNEDPKETCAALYSMGMALYEKQLGEQFEIFIISDSNDPDVWVQETAAVDKLKTALAGKLNVWYRRRHDNTAKKAGNVHEFVSRWGSRYDYMLVLDADSLLSAETLHTLMMEMASDPKSGIIQTLPCLYRGDTLFARIQQFAGAVYGPIVAQGITAWQGNDGNYWGHNAIIRVSAFAEAAGLPRIGGVKPFEGDILSHDFVEAALMRRAGWNVRMLPALKGSWEESPPSLSDVAVRDRRWAQGNIQHLAVLKARGLRWPNRFHMLTGVMAYMASPFWLALILIGIVMAIQIHYVNVEYFSESVSLYPNWPVFDSERMIQLFIFTMAIVLLPKCFGLIRAFFHAPLRQPLGIIRMTLGMLVEVFFSVLYAPIFMLIHSKHILDIFRGQDSGWATQQRQSSGIPWLQLCKQHVWHTAIGIGLTALVYFYSPMLLVWLSPILVGLILSIPLSALSGSKTLAKGLRKIGILNIPEEQRTYPIFETREKFAAQLSQTLASVSILSMGQNSDYQDRHFQLVEALPPVKKGEAPMHRLSVEYKLNDAQNREELLGWLDKKEKLALLNEKHLFDKFCQLAT
ncbi:glucans biosynthesis glucosyltransferase H [Alteromonas halophila]|uniref:Glucans biosynthesis glucosyltransferase H n=1 Tax=Alteromonas halophila TaxID=516698 RepID=A0A918MUL5_9ALTE|nr:glucans biosynthesis glucosyltransferase H [Alteromonas halophila]